MSNKKDSRSIDDKAVKKMRRSGKVRKLIALGKDRGFLAYEEIHGDHNTRGSFERSRENYIPLRVGFLKLWLSLWSSSAVFSVPDIEMTPEEANKAAEIAEFMPWMLRHQWCQSWQSWMMEAPKYMNGWCSWAMEM